MDISLPAHHVPVLLAPIIDRVAPVSGHWLDATFGAGGYTRALLDAGADHVTAIDRDPVVFKLAEDWAPHYAGRLTLIHDSFAMMEHHAPAAGLRGVVFDLGVSSMQLDQAERGFSFQKDGPLDMRMEQAGPSAAELVNDASVDTLADILYYYGEERAARRIARAIVAARPISRSGELADVIARCLPRPKPGQSHPATRSFQALRIAVNDEFGQLRDGLSAAERLLAPGGWLAVVSFHSLEDRVVKRFFAQRGKTHGGNRHRPEFEAAPPGFTAITRSITPDAQERSHNPRARSARLRMGKRTDAPPAKADPNALGLPKLVLGGE